ncbi:MAG: class I SAM-dependent methyltransferase [Spirosomataceae bacterium]
MNDLEHILKKPPFRNAQGVWLLTEHIPVQTHEAAYLKVREKEGRILQDEEVKQLPSLSEKHPNYREWQLRKQTVDRFISFLKQESKPLRILDVGCGNGWFTAKMTSLAPTKAVGLDLNLPELEQAQRLFGNSVTSFCYGDIFEDVFEKESFDKVVLSASIQYFPSLTALFSTLFPLLKPNGEIHILDSPFYKADELQPAKERTAAYYQSMGCSEMTAFYYHHTLEELAEFSPVITSLSYSIRHLLLRKPKSPFPWIMLKKKQAS